MNYLLTLSPLSFLAAGNQPPPGCRAQATTTLTPSAPLATTWSHGELKSLAGWVDVRILKLNQNPKFSLTVLISVPYPLMVTRANLLQMHLLHSCRYQRQWGWIGHRIATWPPAWQPSWNCVDLASLALGSPWPLDWYPLPKLAKNATTDTAEFMLWKEIVSRSWSPLYIMAVGIELCCFQAGMHLKYAHIAMKALASPPASDIWRNRFLRHIGTTTWACSWRCIVRMVRGGAPIKCFVKNKQRGPSFGTFLLTCLVHFNHTHKHSKYWTLITITWT